MRSIAEELRSQGKDAPANLAEQVAGQADRVGDYLKGASGDRILRDAEDFARRQPMLVTAGGLALGFAASRFLKASSGRRFESSYRSHGDGDDDRTYATSPYDTSTALLRERIGPPYGTEVPYAPAPPRPRARRGRHLRPGPGAGRAGERRLRRAEVVMASGGSRGHRRPARPVAG